MARGDVQKSHALGVNVTIEVLCVFYFCKMLNYHKIINVLSMIEFKSKLNAMRTKGKLESITPAL
jgi:hypothetical protein